ncbi:MAG: sulfotransferase domain-containing protein [Limisphaerales bacterium]
MFKTPQLSYLIFASPKSGTTWLQLLLSAHPEMVCTESRAFGNYYHPNPLSNPHLTVEKYVGILNTYFAPRHPALNAPELGFQKNLLFNFMDTLAQTTLLALNKRVYGEKLTPFRGTATGAIQTLSEYNPNVKFINLVRDGRDVVVSGAAQWLNHRLRAAAEAEKPKWAEAIEKRVVTQEDFDLFIDLWTDAVAAGLSAKSLFKNYLQLRYEDYLANSFQQTRQLFEFLQVDSSDAVVRACVEAASFEKLSGGRSRGSEDSKNFFRKGVSGDWRNWFTDEQTQMFAEKAGHLLVEAGYAP